MNPQMAWYVARASGVVAWALVSASVIWGLLLSTRVLHGRPTPRWLLDLHRFLGGLAVAFTGVHVVGLVADNYLHFGLADVLVPLASGWRPGTVALGVVGLWLLLAVEITSLAMRRLPRRWWRRVHLSSYVLFWLATLHGLLAGTDARHPAYVLAVDAVAALVLALTVFRALATPGRARPSPVSRPAAASDPSQAAPSRPAPRAPLTPPVPSAALRRGRTLPARPRADRASASAGPDPTR